MRRFLAINDIPEEWNDETVRASLVRLADAAGDVGVRAIQTVYSVACGQVFTLFEAGDEASIADAHRRAGLPDPRVCPAVRVHTELLNEPRHEHMKMMV